MKLVATFESASALRRQLDDYDVQGAMLLPVRPAPPLQQFEHFELIIALGDEKRTVAAEVLQIIDGVGVVARLSNRASPEALAGSATRADPAVPPVVTIGAEAETLKPSRAPPGMGPLSWPIEKLQAQWTTLGVAEKVRVAKYGKRPARHYILRLNDKGMLNHVLNNPKLSIEEVATIAAMSNLDSATLRRIATRTEWTRNTSVARALICNPKATLPQVIKLSDALPVGELLRLTRTGKVRAAVKRELIKKATRRGS